MGAAVSDGLVTVMGLSWLYLAKSGHVYLALIKRTTHNIYKRQSTHNL
jgi:hypothetical protein